MLLSPALQNAPGDSMRTLKTLKVASLTGNSTARRVEQCFISSPVTMTSKLVLATQKIDLIAGISFSFLFRFRYGEPSYTYGNRFFLRSLLERIPCSHLRNSKYIVFPHINTISKQLSRFQSNPHQVQCT